MKFITVRDLRGQSSQVWKKLSKEQELILTSNGRPIAILSSVTENNLEENLKLFRRMRAISAVNQIQLNSVKQGKNKISNLEINKEIILERKKRYKK